MASNYNEIALDYAASLDKLPAAKHVDDYTFFNMVGEVTGKTILDIGCGPGVYTRPLKQMGAARVVGLDYAPEMIKQAQAEETRSPLGIEYILGDMFAPVRLGSFDLAVASFILGLAPTREHLLKACQMVHSNLRARGRFLVAGLNPELSPATYPLFEKYGYKVSASGPLEEGAIITVVVSSDDKQLVYQDYFHSHADYEWALQTAGFQAIRWRRPMVSPEGLQQFGQEFWRDYIECQYGIYLECVRAESKLQSIP